jgi:NADH-quinone oxidoreductase subunit N
MTDLISILIPTIVLSGLACVLFFLGCSKSIAARGAAPWLGLFGLLASLVYVLYGASGQATMPGHGIARDNLSAYIGVIAPLVGVILLLLAWPTNPDGGGNSALRFGLDGPEFYAMFLLSMAGLLLVSLANDLIILFLALELVSIPTYVMVSMSRPLAAAQEAGVKYFFLGALSVALMLLGFSYLYGATGEINFAAIAQKLRSAMLANNGALPAWQLMGVLLVIVGLAYKMAAFPLHFYAGDVYEGAATPVTAFLAFVPKTAGFIGLIRLLYMLSLPTSPLPARIVSFIWIVAVATMFIGNTVALLQTNVKRTLAYSSIAHSGYMLAGIGVLCSTGLASPTWSDALSGVLFYLAAYGIMNSGAFGVLMLLPSRSGYEAAETFEDLAGQGRRHVALGLAMAVCCFSLIGIPLTVGFLGKFFLIRPIFEGGLYWLAIIVLINAAIGLAYYLRIVATMFLRSEAPAAQAAPEPASRPQFALALGVVLSVAGTLALGTIPHAVQLLSNVANEGAQMAPLASPEGDMAGANPATP